MNPGNWLEVAKNPSEKGESVAQTTSSAAPQSPGGVRKLIYDQDHRGPLSTDTIATLLALQ